MAVENQGAPGLDYGTFRRRVDIEAFTGQQSAPLKLRLDLLESFMDQPSKTEDEQRAPTFPGSKAERQVKYKRVHGGGGRSIEKQSADNFWDFKPGTPLLLT